MEVISIQDHRHEVQSLHNPLSRKPLNVTSPANVEDGINKQQTGKCGHFSIRGYASEVRSNNWKNNWPFSLPSDARKLEECQNLLPPLLIEESRWWACANCLLGFDASAAEVVPIGDSKETAVDNVFFSEEHSLPDYNDHSSQCIKIPRDYAFNGFELSQATSVSDNQREEIALLVSVNDSSLGATEADPSVPNIQIQKEKVVAVLEVSEVEAQEKRVSREICEVAISLDLNKPACSSSSDEVECKATSGSIELEASDTRYISMTDHISHDVECSNLSGEILFARPKSSYQCCEDSVKSPNLENTFSIDNGKPHDIDFSIKEIHSPLDVINPFNKHAFEETEHEHDDNLSNRQNFVGDENPLGIFRGSLKRRRAQKMRLLTDILQNEELNAIEGNGVTSIKVKKKKCRRVMEVKNTNASFLPQELHSQRGSEETESDDLPRPKEKDTANRKESKTCSYEDKQSPTLKGDARLEMLKSLNGNLKTSPLTNGRHSKKIIRRNSQSRELEGGDNLTWRKDGTSKHGAILSSRDLLDTSKRSVPKHRIARTHGEASMDDIPMDIVELLAKNQLERRLNSSRMMTGDKSDKSGSDVKYANRADLLLHNAQNSERTIHFSSPSKCKDGMDLTNHQTESIWTPREFSPLLQNHDRPQSFQNSIRDTDSDDHGWPVNCVQFLDDCHKNQMASQNLGRQVYRDEQVVTRSMPCYYTNNKRCTDFNIKDHYLPACGKSHSVAPQSAQGKGKCVLESNSKCYPPLYTSSVKGNSFYGKVGYPTDLCPSDTVSALNLLMLMQQGASSSIPATSRREKIPKQPHFPIGYYQESSKLECKTLACNQFPAYSMPCEGTSQSQPMRNTLELFPPLGRSGACSSAPFREKRRYSNLRQKFGFRSGFPADLQNFTPNIETRRLDKAVQNLSCSKVISPRPSKSGVPSALLKHLKLPCTKSSLPTNKVKPQHKTLSFLPTRKTVGAEICTLNRNPADFNLPMAGNIYMIGPEDLMPVRASSLKDNVDCRKRHKKQKIATI